LIRKTLRLTVRPYRRSDFLAWAQAWSTAPEPKNRWDRRSSEIPDLSFARFCGFLKFWAGGRAADREYHFGVFHTDGTLIGDIGLMDISRQIFQNAYLGYFVFNRHWGQGYGREAVAAVIDMAFRDLHLHRVEAGVMRGNGRSIALARAVGLRKESFSRRRLFTHGGWQDLVLYAATCEDFGLRWKTSKPKPKPAAR
jgi:ribosomal-protein-alanine N-acetyltransferase